MVRLAVNWIILFSLFLALKALKMSVAQKDSPHREEYYYCNVWQGCAIWSLFQAKYYVAFYRSGIFVPEVIIHCKVWVSEFY